MTATALTRRNGEGPQLGGPDARNGRANWGSRVALLIVCVLWSIPTVGLLITSLRPPDAASTSGWWTVFGHLFDSSSWTATNYAEVLVSKGLGNAFLNSVLVAVPSTVAPILMAAFAAYAFAFIRFPGRDLLFIVLVGLLVVPTQVTFIPLLQLYKSLGLTGQFAAVWLAHTGFGLPLAVYILRNYMATIPHEIIESATIDGANHFTIFWRVIVPVSTPALAAFGIFQFLWVWNDLLVALIFLGSGDSETMTVAMSTLIGSQGQDWNLLTSGAFITMVVPLIVFFSLQRYFVRGLTGGAIKG